MEENKYEINGFLFVSKTDYERAMKEYNNILGLEKKMNVDDIQGLKVVFTKLVSKNYFRTPVGMNFLYELRDYIVKAQGMDDLPPIPVPKMEKQPGTIIVEEQPQYIKMREQFERTKSIKNKMIIAICAMAIVIIGMIFIALTDDNAKYFNAEEKVLNKYSEWQEQLDSKEKELKDYEDNLKQREKELEK